MDETLTSCLLKARLSERRKQRDGWEELAAGQKAECRGQACSGCVRIRKEEHTVSTTAKSEFPKRKKFEEGGNEKHTACQR